MEESKSNNNILPIWQRRHSGKPKAFKTPEALWKAAEEYFIYTDKRKWVKKDWVGKDGDEVLRETETPYTLSGFCIFVGRSRNWWQELKKGKHLTQVYLGVIARIEDIILTQQIEGAMVGTFNGNLTSRLNGITERTDVTSGDKPLPTQPIIMVQSPEALDLVTKAISK